ncbi:hypothetical protein KEM54_004127 [Ascosphaera aggregata]|nr:hypothetical protein KEM54_004127 [Ascosphaera aggregata]
MSTAVIVSNIAPGTTNEKVGEFFNFCGKVTKLEVEDDKESRTAKVTFEKPAAAETALLLDNTQLGATAVRVVRDGPAGDSAHSESDTTVSSPTEAHSNGDEVSIPQEAKPKSRIIAEYLAQGYMFSDQAIEQAIALDRKHGFSNKFLSSLEAFDKKYSAANKARAFDDKYSVSRQATQGFNSLHSYFEKALDTPTGRKLRDFYQKTEKNVLDIHSEAKRLQKEKKEAASAAAAAAAAATTASAADPASAPPPASTPEAQGQPEKTDIAEVQTQAKEK